MYPQHQRLAQELIKKLPEDIDAVQPFEVINQNQKLLLFRLDFSTYRWGRQGGLVLYRDDYNTEDEESFKEEYEEFLVDKGFIIDLKGTCGIGGGFQSFILNAYDRNHHYETTGREIDLDEFKQSLALNTFF
jgi:hypothetical protein